MFYVKFALNFSLVLCRIFDRTEVRVNCEISGNKTFEVIFDYLIRCFLCVEVRRFCIRLIVIKNKEMQRIPFY